jgi:hypothetical protein
MRVRTARSLAAGSVQDCPGDKTEGHHEGVEGVEGVRPVLQDPAASRAGPWRRVQSTSLALFFGIKITPASESAVIRL